MIAGRLILGALGIATTAAALAAGSRDSRHRPPAPAPVVVVSGAMPSPRPMATPLGVSREFVDSYAGFVYGRVSASELRHVSPYLRGQLAAERPNPPAAVAAAADPRLGSLRLSGQSPTAARAVALIADGAAAYELRLALELRRGQWTVTGLSESG